MTSTTGNVDVLIAAWNRSDTIERAICSALQQPEVRTVIVIDDGSTDDTAEVAARVAAGNPRVSVYTMGKNLGPSAARNRGIAMSTAPWIAILDGDDYFLPGRIGKLLALTGDCDLIADDILQEERTACGGSELKPMIFSGDVRPHLIDLRTFVLGNAGRRGRIRKEFGYLKPLIRRAFLDRWQLQYDEALRLGEDYALYARALAVGARFLLVPASGYISVVRHGSLSARHTKEDLERLRDTDKAFLTLPTVARRDQVAIRAHYRSVDARVQWLNVIEAFKSRDISGFMLPFVRAPAAAPFLIRKLIGEAGRRAFRQASAHPLERDG
jgi:succinoglycan biosynthesis protein ExoU